MTRVHSTTVSRTAAFAGLTVVSAVPLIAAPAADAYAIRCGGSPKAEVCFDVHSVNGAGRSIDEVTVFTTNTEHGVYGVDVTMYLLGTSRKDKFKTVELDLPAAHRDGAGQLVAKRVPYCTGLAGGYLPNSTFPQPCHRWKTGYRLGAVMNVPYYGEANFMGEGSSVGIK